MENKKIGLVTVTYVNNYGSHLQSFALQQVLKSLEYEPEIINIESAESDINKRRKKYVLSRVFDFAEMSAYFPILYRRIIVKFDKEYRHIYTNRAKQFRLFGQKHYNIAKKVNGWEELTEQCKESYTAVVIGSDQLWRSANIAGGFYTLEFVPDEINKIAYATSFGLDHVVDQQKEKAKSFLRRINHISVREASGQKIVKELLGRSIPIVSDPTLLLKPDKWDKYVPKSPIIEGEYIFCYFLGTNIEHWKFAKRLKKNTGIKIVGIPYGEKYKRGATDFLDVIPESIGPFEFINLIKNSTYICTDSFHGCAFSINYNKNFFAFYKFVKKGKMSTNSRIDSMLEWTGLSHRIMTGNEKIESNMLRDIEYSAVNKRLDSMRQMSLQYLIDSLKNNQSTDLKNEGSR